MSRQVKNPLRYLAVAVLGCLASLQPITAYASAEQEWRFRVYLDDREIGHHHFTLTRDGRQERLATQAKFDVRFLKIPLFSYRHDNVERWSDNCLEQISSNTDQNGKKFRVEGQATGDAFQVRTNTGERALPACVSTFAYWDKSFLQRDRLLNSQTGEYLDVEVDYLGEKPLALQAAEVRAHHYRLTANKLDIEVWYSLDDRWLALQSTTDSGRLLRYVAE
jgi:hypothetical protein